MKKYLLLITTSSILAFSSILPAEDWTVDQLLASQCAQCHRTDGVAVGDIDSLNGESFDDLVEELEEMKFEESPEDIMDHQSLGYTDAQIKRIARYFASLPKSEEGNHESESEHEENNESDHEEKEDD